MVAFFLSAILACRDEDAVRIPDFINAPNFRLQIRPANNFFNVSDLSTAKLVYDIYSQNYTEIEKVEVYVRYQKVGNSSCATGGCLGPFMVKTYVKSDLEAVKGNLLGEEITIQSLVTLLGLTEADIQGGDQFIFNNVTTMTNGTVYPTVTVGSNTNVPAIYSTAGASYTASFSANVGCPYVAANIAGTYILMADPWEVASIPVGSEIQVVQGPGANQFTVKDIFGFGYDFVADVNPASGAVSSTRQQTWDPEYWGYPASYGKGYATAAAANASTVFTCIGKISFKFSYSVDAGSFAGINDYLLEKQE